MKVNIKALTGQAKAQALRFVRLTALSAFAIWVANGKHLDANAAWGAVVGGGEVVLRSWRTTQIAKLGLPVQWPAGPPVTGLPVAIPPDPPAPLVALVPPVTAPATPAVSPVPATAPAVVSPTVEGQPTPPAA